MFQETYMFHRFRDKNGLETGQGSFSGLELERFILKHGIDKFIKHEDIVSFRHDREIKTRKICLTFDDGLSSQFQIAKPILDKYGIKGFWFIYTKIFDESMEATEILSYIIVRFYKSFQEFYPEFEKHIPPKRLNWSSPDFLMYEKKIESLFGFYSLADKKFRFLRDFVLSKEEFNDIVQEFMKANGLNQKKLLREIWMRERDICKLAEDGHEVGLHSHTHPHQMDKLDYNLQSREYEKNFDVLKKITNQKPLAVAHPLGSYNNCTLNILAGLDIHIGFRSNPKNPCKELSAKKALLQLPRIDANAIVV
jgi:peptidoglycan/xylan/chitin deacetylase (PgdA/CDA1 family)